MIENGEDWLDEWSISIRPRRTPETVRRYVVHVRAFFTWMSERYPEVREAEGVSKSHVRSWLAYLADEGKTTKSGRAPMSPGTVRLRGICLILFYRYVYTECELPTDRNPTLDIELPYIDPEKTPVKPISDDSLAALLKSMSGRSFLDLRDTAIVRLFIDTGMRRIELCRLDLDHVDHRAKEVRVHGKGDKFRVLPFSDNTSLALRRYLRVRETHGLAKVSRVFFLSYAARTEHGRLSPNSMNEMLEKRARNAGIVHIHPHAIRHSWALDLEEAGLSGPQLEVLGGWSSRSVMVRRYTNHNRDKRAVDNARKLARGDRF
ncbi:tyrosine recombinase XerC [Kutzneria viridogrisea]|uniref:Site-specific recombinase XerD n=1 Tax=Kutzneria viridogrisea TaxID=47990 RepID=A0ABR6BRJ5_9PSEU|nr:site-specific recombinase XerD [Kutzneria viridogrisea]